MNVLSSTPQISHTLSVSLNKIGDLKYYDGDLQAARSYYFRSLNVRRDAVKCHPNVPSQVRSSSAYHLLCQYDPDAFGLLISSYH